MMYHLFILAFFLGAAVPTRTADPERDDAVESLLLLRHGATYLLHTASTKPEGSTRGIFDNPDKAPQEEDSISRASTIGKAVDLPIEDSKIGLLLATDPTMIDEDPPRIIEYTEGCSFALDSPEMQGYANGRKRIRVTSDFDSRIDPSLPHQRKMELQEICFSLNKERSETIARHSKGYVYNFHF
jgi:hypothetical protein